MDKKQIILDDFEAPNTFDRSVEINGIERTYKITELCDADVSRVFGTTDAKGNRDAGKIETLQARAVSSCVRRPDGSAISFEEARAMRRPLLDALAKHVLDIHGFGQTEEAAHQGLLDEAKN